MADPDTREASGAESAGGPAGPGGSYEVIRQRLSAAGRELSSAARTLNEQRQELFGGTEAAVLGTERVRTENNCVPVDIVQVGGLMLFHGFAKLGDGVDAHRS